MPKRMPMDCPTASAAHPEESVTVAMTGRTSSGVSSVTRVEAPKLRRRWAMPPSTFLCTRLPILCSPTRHAMSTGHLSGRRLRGSIIGR